MLVLPRVLDVEGLQPENVVAHNMANSAESRRKSTMWVSVLTARSGMSTKQRDFAVDRGG